MTWSPAPMANSISVAVGEMLTTAVGTSAAAVVSTAGAVVSTAGAVVSTAAVVSADDVVSSLPQAARVSSNADATVVMAVRDVKRCTGRILRFPEDSVLRSGGQVG